MLVQVVLNTNKAGLIQSSRKYFLRDLDGFVTVEVYDVLCENLIFQWVEGKA